MLRYKLGAHHPGVAIYWGNAAVTVEAAARSYLTRHELRGSWAYANLLKVVALSMVQYEVILYVDMDADVFPDPRTAFFVFPIVMVLSLSLRLTITLTRCSQNPGR